MACSKAYQATSSVKISANASITSATSQEKSLPMRYLAISLSTSAWGSEAVFGKVKNRVKTANNGSDYHIWSKSHFILPISQHYLWRCHFFVVILLLVNLSATNSNKKYMTDTKEPIRLRKRKWHRETPSCTLTSILMEDTRMSISIPILFPRPMVLLVWVNIEKNFRILQIIWFLYKTY